MGTLLNNSIASAFSCSAALIFGYFIYVVWQISIFANWVFRLKVIKSILFGVLLKIFVAQKKTKKIKTTKNNRQLLKNHRLL